MVTNVKISYTITFYDRPCAVVYTPEIVGRIIRGEQPGFANGTVLNVTRNVTGWEGSWDTGDRSMTDLRNASVDLDEASRW